MLHGSFTKDIGLLDGKMGIVIFFFNYSRFTNNTLYSDFAYDLIDEIYTDLDLNTDDVLCELERHKEWIQAVGFNSTPVILVHGYRLPDCYKIEDLKFFIS